MKKKLNLGMRYTKAYKKRSIAIILSILLSVGLIVGMGAVQRTKDYNDLLQMKYNTGIYHVELGPVSVEQTQKIKNKSIENLGLYKPMISTSKEEKQTVSIAGANEDYIKSNSKILKGRFPKNQNEIIVEPWVLTNLGLDESLNQTIKLKIDDENGKVKTVEFKLVGIMKDRISEKSSAKMEVYTPIDLESIKNVNGSIAVNIAFKEGTDINKEIKSIKKEASLSKEQISMMDDLISIESQSTNIDIKSVELLLLISVICAIVVYGIFNISIYTRVSEYGILRAVGANNLKIFKILLQELFTLYLIGVPLGFLVGLSSAYYIGNSAEKIKTTIVLNGETIKSSLKLPIEILLGSVISMAVVIIVISFITYRKIKKLSVIDSIKKNLEKNTINKNVVTVKKLVKVMKPYKAIAFKNIFRNKKNFILTIVSMSICGVFLITNNYRNYLSEADDFTQDLTMYRNTDLTIDLFDEDLDRGIEKSDLEKIKNIDGVKSIETNQVLYSRMVLDKEKILSQKYFDRLNSTSRSKGLFKGNLATDKSTNELILKNTIRGYDDNALNKLKKYVEEGEINIDKMKKENLVVLYVPYYNKSSVVGIGGEKTLDIKVGDTVKVKYRKDKKLDEKFYSLEDSDKVFVYKEFKVGAIVNYDYMCDLYYTGNDGANVILPEDNFKDITGINVYRSVNINLENSKDNKKVEKEVSKITTKINGAMIRNFVEEKANSKAIYEQMRKYNLGIASILFLITVVNVINNISHSVISRASEFSMLRAIGLNDKDFKKMIVFEGILYGIMSTMLVVIVSLVIQYKTYVYFGAADFDIPFGIRYVDYSLVILSNLVLGVLAAYIPAKKISKESIVDSIRSID